MSEYIETVSTEDANAVIDSKLRKVFEMCIRDSCST